MTIKSKQSLLTNISIISGLFLILSQFFSFYNKKVTEVFFQDSLNLFTGILICLLLVSLVCLKSNEKLVKYGVWISGLFVACLLGVVGMQKHFTITSFFVLPPLICLYNYKEKESKFFISSSVIITIISYSLIVVSKLTEISKTVDMPLMIIPFSLYIIPFSLEMLGVILCAKPLIKSLDESTAKVNEINEQVKTNNFKIIEFCASVLSNHSHYLKFHNNGVKYYTSLLLEELKKENSFKYTDNFCKAVLLGSYIHDIGKISISDQILDKNGSLTDEEYDIIKTHCANGVTIFDKLPELSLDEFTRNVCRNCILYHHEKLDGSGYLKLKGNVIPIESQIIAIADMTDAILSYRAYKKPKTIEELKIIFAVENKDKLNQDLVALLFKHEGEILQFSCSQNDLIKNDLHY